MNWATKTDFYEITMLQAALDSGMANKKATFELFTRSLPEGRGYGVVAGVSRAIDAVMNFCFSDDDLNFLAMQPNIKQSTIDFLKDYRFSGSIYSYRDGDVYFPYSPIMRVEGTFAEAVLLETVLLSIMNHDSAIASAASRMSHVRNGFRQKVSLIEMGSRRTHEDSAVSAALAAYIAGFDATSNIEAAKLYGIPLRGTSAHAFTLLHENEKDAFRHQVDSLGVDTSLLVDTYDTKTGINNAIEVAGVGLGGIRIDSGNPVVESFKARLQLDELGAYGTRIILSSDMDEYSIKELVDAYAPIDAIGVGTRLVTGSGAPTASMVYKLVEVEDDNGNMKPVAKKSSGKSSIGGSKFPYREYSNGKISGEFFSDSPEKSNIQVQFISRGLKISTYSPQDSRDFHKLVMNTLPDGITQLISTSTMKAVKND
ncbi:nicotinate phosphoribosyltransferase [Candidatus Dojkabacteria bacterium]|uniref:Nicotinate phosphoribosyltransferase n=1 Tax=Candidatus Dojkabacteria bacterium TaxID=2099670 RepID=A0A5C7JAE5_9BACT|nr:MAG: nicotinate phosphoribosyltransferase [Candidatus Dojkabacteria bacterium]